jgi:hypothetical protein
VQDSKRAFVYQCTVSAKTNSRQSACDLGFQSFHSYRHLTRLASPNQDSNFLVSLPDTILERQGLSERLDPKYSGLVRASIGVTTGLFLTAALINMTVRLETVSSSCISVPEGWGSRGGSLDRLGVRKLT